MRTTSESRISGIGAYRPARRVTNAEIAAATAVSAEWIEQRTGIRSRYHAGPDEDVVTMATSAAGKAIAMAGVPPAEIDLVILATATKRQLAPAGAPQVAERLGIPAAGAFDLNAVCAGFAYALATASNAVRCGQAENVLVVGSDRLSDTIDPADPDTFVLFGDGAGAMVVTRSSECAIGPAVWGSDGSRSTLIEISPLPDGRDGVRMDGPLVYRWSTGEMPAAARRACALAGAELSDIAWFVPHQANRRIIDTLARDLGIPGDRVARDVVDSGNTSSASIPLALSRLMEGGCARSGDLVLLLGFGSGLSHAGLVVRVP